MQLRYSKTRRLDTAHATADEKKAWIQWWKDSNQTVTKFIECHGGKRSTFNGWIKEDKITTETSIDTFHNSDGRPHNIDPEIMAELKDTVENLILAQHSPSEQEFAELVGKVEAKTLQKLNNIGIAFVKCSYSFVRIVGKQLS